MLVLSRKVGEKLVIGDNIEVTVQRIQGNRVALAITAPDSVTILRAELLQTADANSAAGTTPRRPAPTRPAIHSPTPEDRLSRYAVLSESVRHLPASAS